MRAESKLERGIVRTQAHRIRRATPQRTALKRRMDPTPMMAPVMVCVVLTGIPPAALAKMAIAPALSAQNPPTGCSLVIRLPMV